MSERNDKWLMFKNYLHNELGITKDDIRAWLKEAVQSQAELMLQKTFDDFDMDKFVRNHILTQMRYWTTDEVRRQVASLLADRLVILSTDTEKYNKAQSMITRIEKFGASWCGPCKVLDRTLEQISGIEIVKHDVDEEEDLAHFKGIRNVPVLIYYNDRDEEVKRTVGAVSLGTIMQIVNDN